MTDDKKNFLKLLHELKQKEIIKHFQDLSAEEQQTLLADAKNLDFSLVYNLYRKHSVSSDTKASFENIEQAPVINIPKTRQDKKKQIQARTAGETVIRQDKIAVLIVAGGQGSRLGYNHSKGTFPITPLRNKSLFQHFSESIKATRLKYDASIPLLVMTSPVNHNEIMRFFQSNKFFGLTEKTVHFFRQELLPSITPERKFILKNKTHVFTNPNGHGGSLKALYDSGLTGFLKKEGIEEISYCQVDNPLVTVIDPVFIGYHCTAKAEFSLKVLRRRNAEEKIGIFVLKNGKPAVIEYSDLKPEDSALSDKYGNLKFWAGSIAIHIISAAFVERLNLRGFVLPYHRAEKSVKGLSANNSLEEITAWKFETFVFDAIAFAKKTVCMEVSREEEFSPVKSQKGEDSAQTAKEDMVNLYKKWIEYAGGEVFPKSKVEISPLFALNKEELAAKIKNRRIRIRKDTYFGE